MHLSGMIAPALAGVTLSSVAIFAVRQESQALRSLVDAERAFAARCGKVGFRQSFLENFAETGIFFSPAPGIAHLDLKKQPEEAQPPKTIIEWAPETGDISAAGDMGYTTGPVLIRPAQGDGPRGYGYYFSVWKREAASQPWKVVLDFGIRPGSQPTAPSAAVFKPSSNAKVSVPKPGSGYTELVEMEKEFEVRAKNTTVAAAFESLSLPDVRLHRDGQMPFLDIKTAKQHLAAAGKAAEWVTLGGGISKSGDLGYTYGKYRFESQPDKNTDGYFARVWKRNAKGDWRIAADIANVALAGK